MTKVAFVPTDCNREFVDPGFPLTSAHRGTAVELERIAAEIRRLTADPNGIVIVPVDTHPDPAGRLAALNWEILTSAKGEAGEKLAVERNARTYETYLEELQKFPRHCEYGTDSWRLSRVVEDAVNEMLQKAPERIFLLYKYGYHLRTGIVVNGPHKGKTFAELDAALGIDEYRICGYVTNICVLGTVETVTDLGKHVTVLEAMTNSFSQEAHEEGLYRIEGLNGKYGARVRIERAPKV